MSITMRISKTQLMGSDASSRIREALMGSEWSKKRFLFRSNSAD